MIGFENPFPVWIPFPVRWRGGEMEPDTIQFDGRTIRIRYHKRSTTRGWWDAASIHEIDWLPQCRSDADVLDHFVADLAASPGISNAERRAALVKKVRFTPCGRGRKARLNQNMIGRRKAAGAQDAIYLISQHGDDGALRVWSSHRQSYPIHGFNIGAPGDWPDLLRLTREPMGLEVIEST